MAFLIERDRQARLRFAHLQGDLAAHLLAPETRDVGLDGIADAHGRWDLTDERRLGVDRLEVYERVREG